MKDFKETNVKPSLYAVFFGILRNIAIDHGYSLAIHGSMQRDCDIVAVPWIENPKPALEMLDAMTQALGYLYSSGLPYASIGEKPHGRIAYTLNAGAGLYFDISIINGI